MIHRAESVCKRGIVFGAHHVDGQNYHFILDEVRMYYAIAPLTLAMSVGRKSVDGIPIFGSVPLHNETLSTGGDIVSWGDGQGRVMWDIKNCRFIVEGFNEPMQDDPGNIFEDANIDLIIMGD